MLLLLREVTVDEEYNSLQLSEIQLQVWVKRVTLDLTTSTLLVVVAAEPTLVHQKVVQVLHQEVHTLVAEVVPTLIATRCMEQMAPEAVVAVVVQMVIVLVDRVVPASSSSHTQPDKYLKA